MHAMVTAVIKNISYIITIDDMKKTFCEFNVKSTIIHTLAIKNCADYNLHYLNFTECTFL